jgi:hypothetical protein
MKKQTAVEWLMDRLPTIDKNDPYYEDIIQQAKAMEKEQILSAFDSGEACWYDDFSEYYTSTFGQ